MAPLLHASRNYSSEIDSSSSTVPISVSTKSRNSYVLTVIYFMVVVPVVLVLFNLFVELNAVAVDEVVDWRSPPR